MIPDTILAIMAAIITFIVMSFLYKENHLFSIVEGIAIGFAVGNTLILLLTRTYDQILTPLSLGNMEKLIPLFFGLLMFTFFIPKYRNVYRAVLMGYILIVYGVSFGFGIQTVIQRFISWGEILNIGGVATIIVAVTSLLYLIYSKRLSKLTKYPGYLGYFFIIWMFGWMIGTFQVKHTVGLVQIFTTITTGPGLYIMLIAALALVIDIFVGWRKILRLGPTEQK
jgi:hypothetical protein